MSQENVEVVRHAYEAYNRGDLQGMVADFAPTFEYVSTGAVPGRRDVYRGPEGYQEFVRWLSDEFDDARVEVHELLETGEQVLAPVTLRGRGKQSHVETSWDTWHLWTMHDGKVVHGQAFRSRTDALEAAGMSE
jgi:ketosteroid isomerase-like protein